MLNVDTENLDLVALTRSICDIESVSGDETKLADAVEQRLRDAAHLTVHRDGDALIARTELGRDQRVIIAGHLDTVPVAANLPTQLRTLDDGTEVVWGRGTVDMKAGVAVQLALAIELDDPTFDLTWVFYDHEEVAATLNGLGRLTRNCPELLQGDFAILCEPTNGQIEGGCNGTLRVEVTTRGKAAHSARAWRGSNAIHSAASVLERLASYQPRTVNVDGLDYREGLNAVGIAGGIATNVIPDQCTVTVNYRFAPELRVDQALAHVRDVFDGLDVDIELTDAADGARPGLTSAIAQNFVTRVARSTGREAVAKEGWTDVARFTKLGIPAVNFGPGDPQLAHADEEQCPTADIHDVYAALREWLTETAESTISTE